MWHCAVFVSWYLLSIHRYRHENSTRPELLHKLFVRWGIRFFAFFHVCWSPGPVSWCSSLKNSINQINNSIIPHMLIHNIHCSFTVLEYNFLKKGLKELSFFYLPICISFPVPGRDSAHSSKCDDVKFMREFGQMVTHQVSYKSCFPCNTEGYKDLALNFKRINQVVYWYYIHSWRVLEKGLFLKRLVQVLLRFSVHLSVHN